MWSFHIQILHDNYYKRDVKMIPQNFKDWACSLSGCDGGNIDADIWLCGLEWDVGSYGKRSHYENRLSEEIEKGAFEVEKNKYNWENSINNNYGRSFAKLFAAIKDEKVQDYKELATTKWDGSELFQMNLYPIAFDSINPVFWNDNKLSDKTGFDEKNLFQTWCSINRFPIFSQLRLEKKPKAIICTGVNQVRDFFMCFDGASGNNGEIKYGEIAPLAANNGKKKRRYYWVELDQDTTLFVIPFLSGPRGLNSDYLLEQMGAKIRELIEQQNDAYTVESNCQSKVELRVV